MSTEGGEKNLDGQLQAILSEHWLKIGLELRKEAEDNVLEIADKEENRHGTMNNIYHNMQYFIYILT